MKRILFMLLLFPFALNAQTITLFAGNGLGGYSGDGGPATAAGISQPIGGTFDIYGNYYFAEILPGNKIRKVSNIGIISTFAGTGVAGYNGDNIPATAAQLYEPTAVKLDRLGNFYIADLGNSRVRKVDISTGIITTIAGNGTSGFGGDNGPATAAMFASVQDICFDKFGNLYIADNSNNRVRKVDTNGIITTFAGIGISGFTGIGGPATAAEIRGIFGVTSDDTGNVYITENVENYILKIDLSGIITNIVGNGNGTYIGDGMPATAAQMAPDKIAMDAFGQLFISDAYNDRVYKVDGADVFHIIAGNGIAGYTGNGGPATAASLRDPSSVAFDPCGSLYITESNNEVVRKVTYPPILTTPTIVLFGASTSAIGTSVTISATVANAGGGYIIHWMNHGTQFANTTFPSVSYIKAAGIDTITARIVPTSYGCYDSTTSSGITVTVSDEGVSNVSAARLYMYPNPAHTEITVAMEKISRIGISNLLGQTIYTHEYNSPQVQIDVANLPKGIYFIKINGTEVRKFVKE